MSTKFYNLKQEISNNPQIDEAVSEKGIKDYADTTALHYISPATTAGSSSSPYLSVKWNVESVDGVTTPTDGMRLAARVNRVGVSTAGVALSIDNGITYYPVVYNVNTTLTTHFTVNSSIVLVFNATQTASQYITAGTKVTVTGCWQVLCNYDTNTVTQLRHASGSYIAKADVKRYKILLQYDETTLLPISSGSSTSGHTYDTTNEFNPFGQILYVNSSTVDYAAAGGTIAAGVLTQQQSSIDMRYTFNGGTTMVTTNKDVYLVATPQTNGRAKLDSTPITQTLPSTEDGKIYIYLGHAQSAYQLEIHPTHPIYYYKDSAIREWTNSATSADANYYHTPQFNSGIKIGVGTGVADLYVPKGSNADSGVLMIGTSGDDAAAGNHTHGNISNTGTLTDTAAAPVNGDYIVIRDASNSKIQTSNIAFDGSSQNKYLSQKGTWENVPTCSLVTTTGVNSGVYTVNVPGFRDSLTNYRFALVLKQAPGIQGNIKVNINNLGDKYVYYYNADGQSVSLLGGNVLQVGDVLDLTYSSNGLMLVGIKRGGTNVLPGSVTSVQVQGTSPVQSSQSTAQTGTLNTTISLASGYGDTQNPYGSKTANQVLAAPNGSNGNPSFRSLVAADIPALGNIQNSGALQTNDITIANGDKLVVTDSSDSNKVARTSVAFDGSTTTQYLSKKGTWEDVPADVIVTMDLTQSSSSGSAISYTVSNASHTPTQVVSLISSGKNVKIAANIDGVAFNLDCTHNDSNGLVFSCATVTLALMMYLVVGDTTIDSWVGLSGGLAEYEHHHGYISSTGTMTDTVAPVVNGDAIIVRGGSSNIVGTSDITFDGSTTNQVLSKKGTWVTLPTNTDILVKQTSDTTSTSEFPLLASAQSSPTSGTAYEAKYNANIKIKPSNGTLTATNLVGDGMNIGGIVSFCSCTTAAATAAKQLTVNGTNGSGWTLSAGKIIALSSCTYYNTATNVTFNVNNTGAYPIYYDNAVYSGSDPFITGSDGGRTAYYMFDGTYWVWMGRVQGGVEVQYDTTSAKWPVAFVPFAVTSTSTGFNSLRFNGNIYANPGNGYLYATRFVGNLDGASSRSAVAIANGDALLIADASQSSRITPSTTTFGTSTTTFLRNDGQWATPSSGGGDTGYTSSSLSNNTSTITFGNTKEYKRVIVTGSTQTFNLSVGNNCTNYLLVTNSGSNDCVVAIGVQSGTSITTIAKPSGGITVPSGKTIELSFIKIASASVMGEYTLVVTASEEMSIVSV